MLEMDIVGLSETRWSGSGEISSKSFIYYWSSMNNGALLKVAAISIFRRLQPSIIEVTPIDECIMRLRLKHTLGFISLVATYVLTEMCEADEKEIFYAKFDSIEPGPTPGHTNCFERLQCCH